MTRNSRELSQFASFVEIRDANQNIGLSTSLVMLGGVGIGSTVGDFLAERALRDPDGDPLINFNKSFFLDDVFIRGDFNLDGGETSITGAGATFPALNVTGLTTTKNLVVTGVTTLSRDTGMGTVYIGQQSVPVAGAQGDDPTNSNSDIGIGITGPGGTVNGSADGPGIAHGLVVIDNVGAGDPQKDVALYVSGRVHFNGGDPLITDPANGGETGLGTEFVVVPESLFYDTITCMEDINIVREPGNSTKARLRVFNDEREGDWAQAGIDTESASAAIFTTGGFEAKKFGSVGWGLRVQEYVDVGYDLGGTSGSEDHLGDDVLSRFYGNMNLEMPILSIGMTPASHKASYAPYGKTEVNTDGAVFSQLQPNIVNTPTGGIGSDGARWNNVFSNFLDVGPLGTDSQANMVNLDVGLGATIGYLNVAGVGGTDENEIYLDVGPGKSRLSNVDSSGFFNHLGVATINGFLNVISDSYNNAYVATAFQSNNVDLFKQDETNSTNPEFFYPAMGNSGQNQTDAGAQLFVNPGFYLDAFGTSLFVHNNLNVLGTSILASEENPDLRFDLINYGVTELNFASQARYIDIGEAQSAVGGFTTIRSNNTELARLVLSQNEIKASDQQVNITLDSATSTAFAGFVQIGGTHIKCDSNVIDIADSSQRADLFKQAEDIIVGSNDVGIITIRNNVTELTGFLRLGKNVIQSSDEFTAIQIGLGATYTEVTGDLVVGGKDIQDGIGITNMTLDGDVKTTFYGDIEVRGNQILASDGTVNILMFDAQEATSFTGNIRVEGNNILAGTGDTNITMVANNNTIFAGPIQVNGNAIRASNGQDNIEMDSDVKTTVLGDLQVGTGTMRAGDATICIKMIGGTGDVGITSDLTANSAFFNGDEARLNTLDVNIRDNLLTLGLIEDPLNQGQLIPPNVSVGNSGDAGIVMARYDVGLSTHKYAAIFYDNSQGRIAIRTDVNPDPGTGEVGRDRFVVEQGLPSELEVQNLYINLNSTLGITTIFEAQVSDDGESVEDVLAVVNVEIDAGFF
jgi:hypothetical protein